MPLSPDEENVLRARQGKLTALTTQPGWAELKTIYETRRDFYQRTLLTKMMHGAPADELQREIDFQRGFWACGNWLLANPEQAEASLRKAMAGARLRQATREDV